MSQEYNYDNTIWQEYKPYLDQKKIPKIPGVPVIPPLPPELPSEVPYVAQCGECGILIPNGPWLYSCHHNRCPVQSKITC